MIVENGKTNYCKGFSKNSIASYFKKLRVIFKYLNPEGWIQENPVPEIQMIIKEPKIIPRKDLEDILKHYEAEEKQNAL